MPVLDWLDTLDLPFMVNELEDGLGLPWEDVWKKFDIEWSAEHSLGRSWEDDLLDLPRSGPEIRVHDCMWAGTCLSKDHVSRTTPAAPKEVRPDTPQSLAGSDDEVVTVSANAVTGQRRVPQTIVTTTPASTPHVQFDHNYDAKHTRTEDLGVQTPSDSEEESSDSSSQEEEEIDVVSYKPSSPPVSVVCRGRGRGRPRGPVSRGKKRRADGARTPGRRRVPPASPPSKRGRISTDSETDSTERRSLHNNMERMRRIDLRKAFDELRSLVPSLAESSRAAKVTILRDAKLFCDQLQTESRSLSTTVISLRKEQERLRSNLSKLRKHIASRHMR